VTGNVRNLPLDLDLGGFKKRRRAGHMSAAAARRRGLLAVVFVLQGNVVTQ